MLFDTHGTLLYEATKDLKAVQERLGHSDIKTTGNIYVPETEIKIGYSIC